MNEDKLRERLRDLAGEAPLSFTAPPAVLRRARRRLVVTVTSSILVVVAVVVGGIWGVLALQSTSGGPAVVSPTPTSAPTPLPDHPAMLKPGTYVDTTLSTPTLQIMFTVPSGWRASFPLGVQQGSDESPRKAGLTFWLVENVRTNPCHWSTHRSIVSTTVDGLAAALREAGGAGATAPTDVTFDGYPGKYIQLTAPAHLNLTRCEDNQYQYWMSVHGAPMGPYEPGEVDRLWILDVHGVRLVMDAMFMPNTSARHRAELGSIAASVRIHRCNLGFFGDCFGRPRS